MTAKGRMKPTRKNSWERAYGEHLQRRQWAGEVQWYEFEGMKLRLADNTFYTPDYIVLLTNGDLEAHEVKSFWRDDARVKIKVAAEQFPLRFIAITKKRSEWEFEVFE